MHAALPAILALSFSLCVRSEEECIFTSTIGASNAAVELAGSAGVDAENEPTSVVYAPATVNYFSEELIEDRDAEFFDSILRRRHNTQRLLWASLENSNRQGAAMAHVINCATERFVRSADPDNLSLCVSKTVGDQTSTNPESRCNPDLISFVLIGSTNDENRSTRRGTTACWCEQACESPRAVFRNETGSGREQVITSFVALQEAEGGGTTEASEFEEQNDRMGDEWYQENLVERQSPAGKGVFPLEGPSTQDGTGGTVFRSLRLFHVLEPPPEFTCSLDTPAQRIAGFSRLDRRHVAAVEEEMGKALQQGISSPLSVAPARRSEIALVVTSSAVAAVALDQSDTVYRLASRMGGSGKKARKALFFLTLMLISLFEIVVELLPVYFMLSEEISASRLVETRAFEVIGMGNELAVVPLSAQRDEQFLESASAFAVVTLQNKNTSVVVIAVLAALLTCLSIATTVKVLIKALRRRDEDNVA